MTDRLQKERKEEQDRAWVAQLLSQAQKRNFYGKLHVVMESGEIKRVIKEESLLPPPVH